MDPKQKKILIEFTCPVGPSELKNSIQIHIQSKNIEKNQQKCQKRQVFLCGILAFCVFLMFFDSIFLSKYLKTTWEYSEQSKISYPTLKT